MLQRSLVITTEPHHFQAIESSLNGSVVRRQHVDVLLASNFNIHFFCYDSEHSHAKNPRRTIECRALNDQIYCIEGIQSKKTTQRKSIYCSAIYLNSVLLLNSSSWNIWRSHCYVCRYS